MWNGFKERFRIPRILEFYAATEGNVSLVNVEGMPGAIGRIPPFLAHRFPAALVKYDAGRGRARARRARILRSLCARTKSAKRSASCSKDRSNVGSRFEGYTNEDRRQNKRSCAMCSSRETRGSAPAI